MLLTATCIFLCTLALAESQVPKYTYMVLAQRNLRPGSPLPVLIHFATPVTSERATAKLIHTLRRRDGQEDVTILGEDTVQIPNGKTDAVIELQAPSTISWGSYTLNVSASGSISFENSTTLYGRPKSMAIFVQTDKAMYKPGETVQYRVFAVNRKLSLIDPLMDIEFFDPKGHKIQENIGARNKLGIEGSLPLSDRPPLGRWRVAVKATETDEKEDYYFEVQEYVLPKFEVTVTLPSYGKLSDSSLTGRVKAAYTFGKPVEGHVVLTVSKRYGSGFFDVKAVRTEVELVNGEASFQVPMDVLARVSRNVKYENFLVHARVTETITGITLEGEGDIRYHEHPYRIEFFPNMQDNFKPGFEPYKVWVKVAQQDGRPPESTSSEKLKVTVTYFTDKPEPGFKPPIPNYEVISPFINGDVIMEKTELHNLDKDGMVKFDLTAIPNNTATATIKAEFAGVDSYKEIRRFRSPSNTFLKAVIVNDVNKNPLRIGDIVNIKVYNSAGAQTVKYVVLSRGHLVKDGETVIDGYSEGVIQVKLTREMSPTSRLVVYYISDNGEVVADGLNFVIEDIYENKVKIDFVQSSPQRPKANVDLKVTADRNSLVYVLAVDKSVKLLAEGNDITTERVQDELNQFGDSPWILRGWGPVMPWSFPADDVYDIFDNAQIRVLTDADLHRFDLWRLQQNNVVSSDARAFASPKMGMAAEGGMMRSAGDGGAATGQIRKDFPETWMWKSAIARNGEAIFSEIVPDTITEFVANAFAVNTNTGLGVAPSTANLTVFLPFFVNLQLPYSVVRGETAVIQANIFNYRDQDHNVLVTLKGSDGFEGITLGPKDSVVPVTGDMTTCVLVKKGQPTPVYFNIRPLKVGDIMLTIRADISKPPAMFDEVIRTIPVKAEGEEKEKNVPILVVLQKKGSVVEERDLVYPPELVPDSERIRISALGDVFGPSLRNLDKLIRMPYGCGEQNMVYFAPAVFAVVYMRKTGRFDEDQELQDKIKNVLTTGYQRQLLYQRRDGSFSAFGEADAEGSLWLTAFTAKSFAQAHSVNVVYIDPKVVEKAVEYISKQQAPDGTLMNTGIVSHKALQGATAASERSMMAYVLLALQEIKQAEIIRDVKIIKTLDMTILNLTLALVSTVGNMTSDYERAIGAYALKQVNNPEYKTLLDGLQNSTNKQAEGKKKHWDNPSRALEIEIASYALLTYAASGDKDNGLSILLWLIDNRNPYGGFTSTQDTVVALQALADFATLVYSKDVSLTVDISTRTNGIDANKKQIKLNAENHDLLQYVDIVGKFDKIVVEVKGNGLAMIDINQFFNVESEDELSYELNVTTSAKDNKRYTVTACARYNISNSRSNMAILDIGAVSGFEPVKDQVVKTPFIKRLEQSGSRLVFYFDEIPQSEVCVSVPMQRVSVVASVKPANVLVYSYYEPMERSMKSYLPDILKGASLCEACDVCCKNKNVINIMDC